MTAQQQAFKVYYSSLTDAEVAQEALANELRGRNLVPSEPPPSADNRIAQSPPNPLARMARTVRGWFSW